MAAKQFIGGTGLGEWNTNANWAGGAFATGADTVTFAVTGNPLKVNVASACISIDFTGFTGTVNMAFGLAVTGVGCFVTLGAGMGAITGTGILTISTGGNLTSNGKTWSTPLTLAGATQTYTLVDAWIVSGLFTFGGVSNNPQTINGSTITCTANVTTINGFGTVGGTGKLILGGTTTWTANAVQQITVGIAVDINSLGVVTISGVILKGAGAFTYVTASSLVTTGSTLTFNAALTISAGAGNTYNNVIFTNASGAPTYTMLTNMTLGGNLALNSISNASIIVNGFKIFTAGNLTQSSGSGNYSGTTEFEINGVASIWSLTAGGGFANNLIFNATSFTVSGAVTKSGGTITYTAGTSTTTSSTLSVTGNTTFDTNGMSWNNISPTGTRTITINSLLTITGTWTCVAATTFAGTAGWTVNSWTCITAGVIVTFVNGKTYTLSGGSMTNVGTAASKVLFTSDHAVTKAILTLVGVTEANVYLSGTRMDSSLGGTVWTVGGVLTTTINWNLLTAPATVSSGFVN